MSGYEDVDREKWPVPPEVQGASAVDAYMWWAANGMKQFLGVEPETEFYSDFGAHRVRAGDITLELRWDNSPEEEA